MSCNTCRRSDPHCHHFFDKSKCVFCGYEPFKDEVEN